jgi:hypothetical protein
MAALQVVEQAKVLLPMMQALGKVEPEAAELLAKMDGITPSFTSGQARVIISVADMPRYRFIAALLPTAMRVEIADPDGRGDRCR